MGFKDKYKIKGTEADKPEKIEISTEAYLQAEMLEELTKIMWASRSK
jgi:hypothetical protein